MENYHEEQNTSERSSCQELIGEARDEVRILDPELFEDSTATILVEQGLLSIQEVTTQYGTRAEPKWSSGTVEQNVLMSYHNGGMDGHTSVGPTGAGVPRNALRIANMINEKAGFEVVDVQTRGAIFKAAAGHDSEQLCGRSLLPEGQGSDRGDEAMSATRAYNECLDAGIDHELAATVFVCIMATAINPKTMEQNVDYGLPEHMILAQEITACADLLGPSELCGVLDSVELAVEELCLAKEDQTLTKRLELVNVSRLNVGLEPIEINTTEDALSFIGDDLELRSRFGDIISKKAKFFSSILSYPDKAIKGVCGADIGDMFPGLMKNAEYLQVLHEAAVHDVSPLEIWNVARLIADGHIK
jgi:hypothetical protein